MRRASITILHGVTGSIKSTKTCRKFTDCISTIVFNLECELFLKKKL